MQYYGSHSQLPERIHNADDVNDAFDNMAQQAFHGECDSNSSHELVCANVCEDTFGEPAKDFSYEKAQKQYQEEYYECVHIRLESNDNILNQGNATHVAHKSYCV